MSSIFGRAIIVPKTNKSGGALAKGDVVIVDTSNDNAVTTTTSAATTVTVGVVVEENGIANNASGRVQFGGHVALVNVNASVTRGHYALTHTVAKQAADGGASRVVGAFGLFTTGGTTPEADLFSQPDGSSASGNVATDAIWDAAGDLAVATGANTAAKLVKGSDGTHFIVNPATSLPAWVSPHSTLGYDTPGASFKTTRGLYVSQITIPAGGRTVAAIWANLKGNGSAVVTAVPLIMSDNGSNVPLNLIYGSPPNITLTPVRVGSYILNTTARWVGFPCGLWFAAATKIWIGVWLSANNNSEIQLAFDASGGTSYLDTSTAVLNQPADVSIDSGNFASSTDKYSIYADLVA